MVPDSVFICTKSKDEKAPKGLFANFKMNQFFGCDVLQSATAVKKSPWKKKKRSSGTMTINGR